VADSGHSDRWNEWTRKFPLSRGTSHSAEVTE
jgi:hypothetical protein